MKKTSSFAFRLRGVIGALGLGLVLGVNAHAGGNRLANLATPSSGSSSGSTAATSQTTTPATTATSQAVQTSVLAARAQASLQTSLQALQAQQAAQSAARATALTLPNSVPNGLVIGGLVPDAGLASTGVAKPVTTWVNANTPTQSIKGGQTTVTVTQTAPQALLNWQTFNVGANTTLNFDQSAGGANVAQWIAINKVAANIAPSQILGSIAAQGQVYVINQNGIIFSGSSQVNVGALVASSLPINDNLIARGLLNNPDDQFLFSQANIAAGSQGPTAAFTPQQTYPAPTTGTVAHLDAAGKLSRVPASGLDGDVAVQAGAQLTSPASSANVGGKIALVGPNVANAGTIATPNGQTILAAGNQVGFAAHNGNDPTLRGLDVYVGSVDAASGTVANTGLIDSPEADILLTGKTVNQNGVIDSSTSVSYNGRIDLLADYNSVVSVPSGSSTPVLTPSSTDGVVTLGAGSVTQIVPELSSTQTVVGAQLALSSLVNIQGGSIALAEDALLYAPSAALPSDSATNPALGIGNLTLGSGVTLNAGSWLFQNSSYSFVNTSGQIDLAPGASIDVSGSENVSASVTENIISAQLLGTELANSPLQQNGPLRGQTIDVDLRQTGVNADGTTWIGTPLADVSGYVNLVPHTVGELTTNGGTVGLNAGQGVNFQAGSTINVSGGWINYQGALVQTTKVVTAGQVLDIAKATPNLVYDGIYTGYTTDSVKWGISQTYANSLFNGPQYEAGYIQGGSGGALSVTAPAMTVSGSLYGNTVAGANQRTLASQLTTAYAGASYLPTVLATQAVPAASTLSFSFQGQNAASAGYPTYSPTPVDVVVQAGNGPVASDPFAATSSAHPEFDFSSDLINLDGFGNVTINNGDGNIAVPAGVALTTSAGGSITFKAANLDIEGSLIAPAGQLKFTVYDYTPYVDPSVYQTTPPPDSTRGVFTLGATASLSTAGLLVDDRATAPAPDSLPLAINGGSIAINTYSADLVAGSSINVSGGVAVSEANKITYGNGGSLSLLAGQDPNFKGLIGGQLVLASSLEGYSGNKGGSLTLQAPLVQIGGMATDPANTLLLSPDFFTKGLTAGSLSEGGFASITLEGLGEVAPGQSDPSVYLPAVDIVPGVTVAPLVQNWVATLSDSTVSLTTTAYPLASERTPASLSFVAEGVNGGSTKVRGDFVLGAGSVIETDPKGGVTISGNTAQVLGSIVAPGGKITISGAKNSTGLFDSDPVDPLVTLDLGPNSLLSTAGVVELTVNAFGYTTGSVLPGGTISVSGNILAEKGAVLDVSGTSGVLDVSPTQVGLAGYRLGSPTLVSIRIDSAGGSITLAGGQEMVSDATLRGAAGGPSGQGGSLTVSSQLFDPSQGLVATTPLEPTLDVTQSALAYSSSGLGSTVLVNGTMAALGYFAADSFNASGLDALTLSGTVQFSGPVVLTANRSLTVGSSGIILTDPSVNNSSVTLTAPYVALGQAFQGPLTLTQQQAPIFIDSEGNAVAVSPTSGTGSVTVNATSLIDVGNLSLQNIANLTLVSRNGDVRGDGTLDVAGNIAITAGQIYPTTDTTFTLAAYDHAGVAGAVTIHASGNRPLPLSAGGTLNIFASDITQGGVLRAPLGTINLGSGVMSANPTDPLSGQTFDPTQSLTLATGSTTSVSAVDPTTGSDLTIPYGTILNGVSWIDPAGNDITVAGNGANAVPAKAINVSAVNVVDQPGSTIDISGGGDLYAYRFVSGTGGTKDILASTTSFAVIPGYSASYAPYYSSSDYANATLGVGSQVYLSASSGLPAGVYTLLPARYALLPGAFLVTPNSTAPPAASITQNDGSNIVAGYRFNGLDQAQTSAPLLTSFEVDSPAVIKSRAEYDGSSANTFLRQSAAAQGISLRLPVDAGQLVVAATSTMTIQGMVSSQTPTGGLGSQVDLASPSDILISGPNTDLSGVSATTLVLDSSDLSAFGADSLLIGGYRTSTTGGVTVTVTTNHLTVDNAGAALSGPDVILTSNQTLTLAPNADVAQSGALTGSAEMLLLGNSAVAGSGDGALVRVSSDSSSSIVRSGLDGASGPSLVIGAGATIAGDSLILDSTSATTLNPAATLRGDNVSLNSGQISLVLDDSQPTSGLVLSSAALGSLQASVQALSLVSYSSIDIYASGTGTIGGAPDASGAYPVKSLALHADEIQGIGGGTVSINAQSVTLNNSPGGVSPSLGGIPSSGALVVNAGTVQLGGGSGTNTLAIDGYADVNLNATTGLLVAATASATKDSSGNNLPGSASLTTAGNLQITTPVITGATGSSQTITANGSLTVNPATSTATVIGGLGATLKLVGASVTENSVIQLPSGNLSLEATGVNGNVTVGGTLEAGGSAQSFNDLIKYTSGGQINLTSDSGSVVLNPGSTVAVAANSGGGNAGSLTVVASTGVFTDNGVLLGQAGTAGAGGTFSLDAASLPGGKVDALDSALGAAGFNQSISIRDRTDTAISIDGTVRAASYNLSADQGSITVTGTIDASNVAATDPNGKAAFVGGAIDLEAAGSITLASGSLLTVAAQNFSNAGKGGAITLAAGSEINGAYSTSAVVDLHAGSTVNLSVAANTSTSAAAGDFTGTLHLRAPQLADGSDLQVNPIAGTILGASNIIVEGYKLYVSTDGLIDSLEGSAASSTANDGTVYGDAAGFAANTSTILSRLLTGTPNANQAALFQITPGAEIINPNVDTTANPTAGDLTLASSWNLASFRFGPNVDPSIPGSGTPGVLTLRAGGNLIFHGSLSDGFTTATNTGTLLTQNATSPANDQSWSYNFVAGADLSAADFQQVAPTTETYDPATGLAVPGTPNGSLELGKFVTQNDGNAVISGGNNAKAGTAQTGFYQVIRTGTGDITIAASGDLLLQNQFATIFTAGVGVADPTLGGTFAKPVLKISNTTYYGAQYSVAGGNVTIAARGNIAHVTQDSTGAIVLDSEKELPNNWLYRRGYVDPTTGAFGPTKNDTSINPDTTSSNAGSTTWWVDFSNFFEGVGALGGGNVTLTAGHDVSNVDAVAPTNARVTNQTIVNGKVDTLAADQTLVELGGGNVVVQAANDINGGVFYVERGQGTLAAGNGIITNFTRSASLGTFTSPASMNDSATWLPTTLFLGDGSFDVTAQNDLLLGPVANPFLLPQGVDNTYWDKTYFSTYATTDAVNIASLTGTVTLRESATLDAGNTATPLLQNWLQAVDLLDSTTPSVSYYQPWLRLTETSVDPFITVDALMPGTLQATAFSGNIDTVGNLTLSPSPTGTVDLIAAGSINGLQPTGVSSVFNSSSTGNTSNIAWSSTTINLSDANPASIPGVLDPYAYEVLVGTAPAAALTENGSIKVGGVSVPVALDLSFINNLLAESGSTEGQYGVLQTKLQLHASINGAPLHANDSDPVHLYADTGNISGLTLFSGKAARVVAGQDITDIALYVQNDSGNDVSLVAAGRDLVAYDANSLLREAAQAAGNVLDLNSPTLSGDLQISGPGTLEVLAGRDLNLGVGPNNTDGTGVGISSIGNQRNPVLPFAGADIVAAAGVGASAGLDASAVTFTNTTHTGFTDLFLNPATGGTEATLYLPELGGLMGLPATDSTGQIWTAFSQLPVAQQDTLALDIFYLVLRDSGRDHVASGSDYTSGYAAIAALFPGQKWQGDISLTSREIKTTNGGNISLLAPGGSLDVGLNVSGTQAVDQGILTEDGGGISIFTNGDVNVGTSRIFTLNGGDEVIWSTSGNIDAGASSKTVQSAPPTRVIIDPQSGAVETDLAGLATGGGIGTLETTQQKNPASVDLIAPTGTINAGDAGIRASGDLHFSALVVNPGGGGFSAGGKTTGAPSAPATPNVASLSASSNAAGASSKAASDAASQARNQSAGSDQQDLPSIITVEVLGYGGGTGEGDEE